MSPSQAAGIPSAFKIARAMQARRPDASQKIEAPHRDRGELVSGDHALYRSIYVQSLFRFRRIIGLFFYVSDKSGCPHNRRSDTPGSVLHIQVDQLDSRRSLSAFRDPPGWPPAVTASPIAPILILRSSSFALLHRADLTDPRGCIFQGAVDDLSLLSVPLPGRKEFPWRRPESSRQGQSADSRVPAPCGTLC